jgi:predicted transcriptional regulator
MIRYESILQTIAGLTPQCGHVFANLVTHGGRARTMDELVSWCTPSKPTVFAAIKVLEAVKLIEREYVHVRNETHHVEIFIPDSILMQEE